MGIDMSPPQDYDLSTLTPILMKNAHTRLAPLITGLAFTLTIGALAQGPPPPLGPPPVPPQNQITPAKAILGKALFWDEQLSSSSTVSCGTCHQPAAGGGDPRNQGDMRNPGVDGILGTPDDILGSLGVARTDANGDYQPHGVFGHDRQVTSRATPSNLMGAYFSELFWDGRATSEFTDPLTGNVVIPSGGALESQSLAPILSSAEMANDGRSWSDVTSKLENVEPLAVAFNLPGDLSAALAGGVTYPDLFQAAFGTNEITPVRIGLALATYQRTLVPNQTPWDSFTSGNQGALSQGQQMGLGAFVSQGSRCNACHGGNLFADNQYHNLGLRPISEDSGRQAVTGVFGDRGRFKTPSLRNVGLRGGALLHNGSPSIPNLNSLLAFYDADGGQFGANKDPILNNLNVPPNVRPALRDFLINGLTDPRAAAELPPFDRPNLSTERIAPPIEILQAEARAGSGGFTPQVVALSPPHVGNPDWKLGVYDGLGGANALVTVSNSAPSATIPSFSRVGGGLVLNGSGPGQGYATWHREMPSDPGLVGLELWLQWRVRDMGARGGVARSPVVHLTLF